MKTKITVEEFLSKARCMVVNFAETQCKFTPPKGEIEVRVDNVHYCLGNINGLFEVYCSGNPRMYAKVHYESSNGAFGLTFYSEIGYCVVNGER